VEVFSFMQEHPKAKDLVVATDFGVSLEFVQKVRLAIEQLKSMSLN
jgi:hypothetical protein